MNTCFNKDISSFDIIFVNYSTELGKQTIHVISIIQFPRKGSLLKNCTSIKRRITTLTWMFSVSDPAKSAAFVSFKNSRGNSPEYFSIHFFLIILHSTS